jgi:hypothetical protein
MSLDENALLRESLVITIDYHFPAIVANPTFGIVVYTEGGTPVFGSNTMYHPLPADALSRKEGSATVTFPQLPLWSGRYHVSVWLSDGWAPVDNQEHALTFEFISQSAPLNAPSAKDIGAIHLPATWTLENEQIRTSTLVS